jgi:hypothetical protein
VSSASFIFISYYSYQKGEQEKPGHLLTKDVLSLSPPPARSGVGSACHYTPSPYLSLSLYPLNMLQACETRNDGVPVSKGKDCP